MGQILIMLHIMFAPVFINDDVFPCKYSLDEEAADDSRCQFVNEISIRKQAYQAGDERQLLEAILIRYAGEYGGNALLR